MTEGQPPDGDAGRARAERGRQDAELVARAAEGDRAAFARLYRAHSESVFRFVLFRVRDTQSAEDVTQDVFIRAYRGLRTLRDPQSFRAWLLRIAHNCVLTHVEQQGRRPEDAEPPEADVWRIRADRHDPEEDAADALDLQSVVRACADLTELQRQVIALRFISGLSVAETAAIMSRTPNAIHNLQHHALAGLRRRLAPDEGQDHA